MKKLILFLLFVLLLTVACSIVTFSLEPFSILYTENGEMTFQYIIYAFVGVVIETPIPFWALFFTEKIIDKTSAKDFLRKIFKQRNLLITVFALSITFFYIFLFATCNGKRLDNNILFILVSFPVLIIGGGIEEVGWRGYLQPELEKHLPYPVATLVTAIIWWSWHLPLWLQPSSNHYNDSMIGFLIMIITWSFLLSLIYKITKSTFACVLTHAFVNSIGAVYDWNDLFDYFPTRKINIVCYVAVIVISIVVYYVIDRREKRLELALN